MSCLHGWSKISQCVCYSELQQKGKLFSWFKASPGKWQCLCLSFNQQGSSVDQQSILVIVLKLLGNSIWNAICLNHLFVRLWILDRNIIIIEKKCRTSILYRIKFQMSNNSFSENQHSSIHPFITTLLSQVPENLSLKAGWKKLNWDIALWMLRQCIMLWILQKDDIKIEKSFFWYLL